MTKSIVIFCAGTYSTIKETKITIPHIMNSDNIISSLYKGLSSKDNENIKVLQLRGSGTGLTELEPEDCADTTLAMMKFSTFILGGMFGFIGTYHMYKSSYKAAYFTIDQLKQDNQKANIFIFGWSRGAVSVLSYINKLNEIIPNNIRPKINKIRYYCIDHVPGLAIDRGCNLRHSFYDKNFQCLGENKVNGVDVKGKSYISDTADVEILKPFLKDLPNLILPWRWINPGNMLFFSGLLTKNTDLLFFKNDSHQDLVLDQYKSPEPLKCEENAPIGKIAGHIVFLDILEDAINNGAPFKWNLQEIIEEKQKLTNKYQELLSIYKAPPPRGYLTHNNRLCPKTIENLKNKGLLEIKSDGNSPIEKGYIKSMKVKNNDNILSKL